MPTNSQKVSIGAMVTGQTVNQWRELQVCKYLVLLYNSTGYNTKRLGLTKGLNAQNVRLIYVFNSVVNTKLPSILSHRRGTTVSLETYPLILTQLEEEIGECKCGKKILSGCKEKLFSELMIIIIYFIYVVIIQLLINLSVIN